MNPKVGFVLHRGEAVHDLRRKGYFSAPRVPHGLGSSHDPRSDPPTRRGRECGPEARPGPSKKAPVPSKKQVDQARADVASKKQSVAQLESQLAAANAQLQQAALDASVAAEAYNGAMWKLSEAKKSVRKAEAQEEQAKKDVKDQRSGIVTFVTDSYQNGTELNSATAVMGGEGPKGLMNRYGVVESAGDSMEAAYDDFRKATVVAKTYTKKAAKAQKRQEALAVEARELRNAAESAANSAAVAAGPDRLAEGRARPGTRRGPEHLDRAGGQAAEGARADRATGSSQGSAGEGRRAGQGRRAPKGRQGLSAEREGCQAGPQGRPRTRASPSPAARAGAATSTRARPSTDHRRHPAPAPSARSPTPRRSSASPTSGRQRARTRSTAPA